MVYLLECTEAHSRPGAQDIGIHDLSRDPHFTDEQAWALGRYGICARSVGIWEGDEA